MIGEGDCLNFMIVFFPLSAHIRTGSTGSLSNSQLSSPGQHDNSSIASSSQEEMRCFLEHQHQGHQQLVTCMDVVGNTVLTGSQDHTLKVSHTAVINCNASTMKILIPQSNCRCFDWI